MGPVWAPREYNKNGQFFATRKKTSGRHLKKSKASFRFFAVSTLVERMRFKLMTSTMP